MQNKKVIVKTDKVVFVDDTTAEVTTIPAEDIRIEDVQEYRNRFGVTAFQYGDTITDDVGKLYLTAINCAIAITRIKRDKIENQTIAKYLMDMDLALCYAWNNTDSNGTLWHFDGNRLYDVQDAVQDCVTALLTYAGDVYTLEIAKRVRNTYGKRVNDMQRSAETDIAVSVEALQEKETCADDFSAVPLYSMDDLLDDVADCSMLSKAIAQCDLSVMQADILTRIANGEKQGSIATDYGVHRTYINKIYKEVIARLRDILIPIE